jgi:hypothetical protein
MKHRQKGLQAIRRAKKIGDRPRVSIRRAPQLESYCVAISSARFLLDETLQPHRWLTVTTISAKARVQHNGKRRDERRGMDPDAIDRVVRKSNPVDRDHAFRSNVIIDRRGRDQAEVRL